MRCTLFLILSFFTMTFTRAQFSDKRQLFIFGQPQSEPVKQQLFLLDKDAKGVQERDMTIVLASGSEALYRKYKVAASDPFVLILVGKDGGEKYRSQKPVATEELFGIIDAMPMRQSEMRRKKDD